MISCRKRYIIEAACEFKGYAIEVVDLFIEAVVAFFEVNVLKNKKTRGHAKRQTGYIQHGIDLIFQQVPECDLEVVAQHMKRFWSSSNNTSPQRFSSVVIQYFRS